MGGPHYVALRRETRDRFSLVINYFVLAAFAGRDVEGVATSIWDVVPRFSTRKDDEKSPLGKCYSDIQNKKGQMEKKTYHTR